MGAAVARETVLCNSVGKRVTQSEYNHHTPTSQLATTQNRRKLRRGDDDDDARADKYTSPYTHTELPTVRRDRVPRGRHLAQD